ncbi:MAG: metalloregulator ArsR/SmtB family transcription factor [Chloroflexi bacterium]|nr:metalloregulator ArsR/SmtB family transcription factor [Chloroflexota bacterium]
MAQEESPVRASAVPAPAAPSRERCEVHGLDLQKVGRGRALLLNDEVYFDLAETFRMLADSSRAKIVYSLLHQELCTCDMAAIVGLSESAVSQHLRGLRMLRVVKSRREGKQVFHSLDDSHVRILLNVALNHSKHSRPREDSPQSDEIERMMSE